MKRVVFVCAMLLAASTVTLAQFNPLPRNSPDGQSYSVPKITLRGYLVDKACVSQAAKIDAVGPTHATACALAATSPLGIVQNGVFCQFDEKGAKKALDLLKKTKLTRGVMVQVTGNMGDTAFVVSSLKELKAGD